jgi:flagellar biosynthesis anti-sigma factor FlgM
MDIRSSLDVLKTLLGVAPAATATARKPNAGFVPDGSSLTTDHATLSSAGSEVAQTAMDGGVRTAKVEEIQAALQAGTYDVPASAVAARIVDAMLERGK